MTGEPDSKRKYQYNAEGEMDPKCCPFVLKSTLIENGSGKAIVCAVGINSQIGKLEQLLNGD
jgi:magnesium-transporting ATPase (P-type)